MGRYPPNLRVQVVELAESIDPVHHSGQTLLPVPSASLHGYHDAFVIREYRDASAYVPGCNSCAETQLNRNEFGPSNIYVSSGIARETVLDAIIIIEHPRKPITPESDAETVSRRVDEDVGRTAECD